MKLRFAAAALALAAVVALTGCGGDGSGTSGDSVPSSALRSIPRRDPSGLFETRPVVDGTELICMRDDSYGSTTCNWELWNKLRDTTKK